MEDEIKEILDDFDYALFRGRGTIILNQKDIKLLLEYITNLQEENERLKNGYCKLKVKCNNGECDCTNEEYEGMVQANMRCSLLLDDYKSRNEKAIEYIKQNSKCGGSFIDDKFVIEYIDEIFNGMELLNILNGGDEE